MIQTATINPGSHSGAGGSSGSNGKIIARSPNSSPNKLNATKKPMIANQASRSNFTGRNRGGASPGIKCNTNNMNNFITNYHSNPSNYTQNGHNNFNINPNIKNPPLINSNGYQNRGLPVYIPNSYDRARYCQNHPNKISNYVIQAEDGQYGYCQKCAINLASRGISVIKRDDKIITRNTYLENDINIFQQHKLSPFYGNKFIGTYGYSQIGKFISQIQSIHSSYLHQIHKYQIIEQHYQHQYIITQQFYQNLFAIIQQMRQDHLADLQAQAKKHTQIAYIKQDHLKSDLNQVEIIREDIVKEIENILQRFDQPEIQHALNQYKLQALLFKSKVEEENAEFQEQLINQKQHQLQKRLKLIQEYLLTIWNDKSNEENDYRRRPLNQNANPGNRTCGRVSQDRSPKNIKNILHVGEKTMGRNDGGGGGSTAYRKLFDDEIENSEIVGESQSGQMINGREVSENQIVKIQEGQQQLQQHQQQHQQHIGEENNKQIASPQFKNI